MSRTSAKERALRITHSAVLALHRLMEARGLTLEHVAQEMCCSAEDLEAWLAETEDVGVEDFMTFWTIVLGPDEEDDKALGAFTERRIRRSTGDGDAAEGTDDENAVEGELDPFLEPFSRSLQLLVREGTLDDDLLEYLILRNRKRRREPPVN